MNRIDTLHIQNFKFFQKQKPIKLGGNHLLLYGENGSGKSSVYWSLYTLFEASLKSNNNDIKKYFSKTIKDGNDCLVNIHAQETVLGSDDYESFIELITDDPVPKRFIISKSDEDIETVKNEDNQAKYINYASDFINYRLLLSFSSFQHSDPIDLYWMFVENIFKYYKFAPLNITREGNPISYVDPYEIWKQIEIGPDEFLVTNEEELDAYKATQAYTDFEQTIEDFNNRLDELIALINLRGPEYLEKLGYDFSYMLSVEPLSYELKAKEDGYELKPFKIKVRIPEYEGVTDAVKKPHSFLNEAKLSAIAISLRLAILRNKLDEDCLKFIVLDDLLISLDMSNREKVLEVLLSAEFSSNYQLLILSHDFSFFQLCKRKIADAAQTNWKYYELYVDDINKLPVLLPSESSYAKACSHLKNFDYPAAGNYFRKATEEIFENDFPREVTIADSGEKRTTLKGYLDTAIKLYERIGHSTANLKTLDNYLFLLLNPLSHRAIDTNVYKTELNRVKALLPLIIQEVQVLNFRKLISVNNNLVIHFVLNANNTFEYFIKTREPIYMIHQGGQDIISNSKCKSYESSTITNGGAPVVVKNENYDFLNLELLHRDIYTKKKVPYDNSMLVNIFHLAQNTNQRTSLQNLLDSYN
jgi:hypothetical protein